MMNYLRNIFGPKNASSVILFVKKRVTCNSYSRAYTVYDISYSERGRDQYNLCVAGAKRVGLTNLDLPDNEKVQVRFTVERV